MPNKLIREAVPAVPGQTVTEPQPKRQVVLVTSVAQFESKELPGAQGGLCRAQTEAGNAYTKYDGPFGAGALCGCEFDLCSNPAHALGGSSECNPASEAVHPDPSQNRSTPMRPRVRKTIFVTERPLMVVGFRELLHWAGLGAEHSIVAPAELAHSLQPGEAFLIVIDSEFSPGWESLARLRANRPESVFVLWCGRVTPQFVQAAMETGIHGLLSTKLPIEEASRALLQICQGERNFRFDIDFETQRPSEPRLTRREQQVLAMVTDGLKNREIAAALRMTEGSVKVYLNRVFRKTGARSRYELALIARSLVRKTEGQNTGAHGSAVPPSDVSGPFDKVWMFPGAEAEASGDQVNAYDSVEP